MSQLGISAITRSYNQAPRFSRHLFAGACALFGAALMSSAWQHSAPRPDAALPAFAATQGDLPLAGGKYEAPLSGQTPFELARALLDPRAARPAEANFTFDADLGGRPFPVLVVRTARTEMVRPEAGHRPNASDVSIAAALPLNAPEPPARVTAAAQPAPQPLSSSARRGIEPLRPPGLVPVAAAADRPASAREMAQAQLDLGAAAERLASGFSAEKLMQSGMEVFRQAVDLPDRMVRAVR